MKTDSSKIEEKILLKRFVSHGTPVEIYLETSPCPVEEARKIQADFFLTLLGIEHKKCLY